MPSPLEWHINIDDLLNPILPPSPLRFLPYPIAHFLGHRTTPTRPLGNLVLALWAFVGIFGSIAIIEVVARAIPDLNRGITPICIGSFGAAAVLEFYAIESPLAQPRNAFLGQILSSLVGVAFRKLFALSPDFAGLRWLAASLSCASATALMAMTGTAHPPAGATALLAVADEDLAAIGWLLVPIVALDCVLMLGVALLVNNSLRRYPVYWWSPEEVGGWWVRLWRRRTEREDGKRDSQAGHGKKRRGGGDDASGGGGSRWRLGSESSQPGNAHIEFGHMPKLVITRGEVLAPDDMFLRPEERMLLEALSQRL